MDSLEKVCVSLEVDLKSVPEHDKEFLVVPEPSALPPNTVGGVMILGGHACQG